MENEIEKLAIEYANKWKEWDDEPIINERKNGFIEGYKAALSKGNGGDVSWEEAFKRYDEVTPTFLQSIGSLNKFLLKFYTLKAKE